MSIISTNDEQRLRELAAGLAKDVEDPDALIGRLGFSRAEYEALADTRVFKSMLAEAFSEWQGANNTHKRIKLKAAVNIEEALPSFYRAMISDTEPLSSKVKAFEAVARVGGLGNPELTPAGGGQFFKLEINLGAGVKPITLTNDVVYSQSEGGVIPEAPSRLSRVFDGMKTEDW